MTSSQKRNHDNFFRTIFADPKNTANLISLAAKNNPNLKELLDLINLETLQEISGAATREGASGSGDLTFKVEIKNSTKSNRRNHSLARNKKDSNSKSNRPDQLLVGLILEHKSYRDSKIRNQLLKYYFEVMHQKAGNIPAVAIIVYNGRDKWNPLKIKPHPGYPEFFQKVGLPFRVEFIDLGREPVDFSNLDPLLALAIAAMRMVFDAYGAEKYFKTALRRLLKSKQNFRSIVEEILVYLRGMLPEEEKEMIMDSLEVIQNKGYVSIADADYNRGFSAGEEKGFSTGFSEGKAEGFSEGEIKGITDAKLEMAKAMLVKGYPISDIAIISGLSEEEILKL